MADRLVTILGWKHGADAIPSWSMCTWDGPPIQYAVALGYEDDRYFGAVPEGATFVFCKDCDEAERKADELGGTAVFGWKADD